jgi:hypothetical protein
MSEVASTGLPTEFGEKNDPASGPSGSAPTDKDLRFIASLQCWAGFLESFNAPLRPIVVERSGGINYTNWRSLDNTYLPAARISIVHIEENGLWW